MAEIFDISWHLTNLLGWLAMGGIAGFLYAYRRIKREQQDVISENADLLQTPGQARGHLRGTLMGYRLGGGLVFAALGAIGGAVIWAIATGAALLLN